VTGSDERDARLQPERVMDTIGIRPGDERFLERDLLPVFRTA
jgi:hypothetical protein